MNKTTDKVTGKPMLLDLYCGAGGASMGYFMAGFDVVGVDIKPQPHYPFKFVQMDALDFLAEQTWHQRNGDLFQAVHASPPCQKFTRFQQSQPQRVNKHPDLIAPTRAALKAFGVPYVIENVPGAPLENPVQFCGTAFDLGVARGQLWRHRMFESSTPLLETTCFHDGRPAVMVAGHGVDGYRGSGLCASDARQAMRIDWMTRDELKEAIPPAYAEFVGLQLMAHVVERAAEALRCVLVREQ